MRDILSELTDVLRLSSDSSIFRRWLSVRLRSILGGTRIARQGVRRYDIKGYIGSQLHGQGYWRLTVPKGVANRAYRELLWQITGY